MRQVFKENLKEREFNLVVDEAQVLQTQRWKIGPPHPPALPCLIKQVVLALMSRKEGTIIFFALFCRKVTENSKNKKCANGVE